MLKGNQRGRQFFLFRHLKDLNVVISWGITYISERRHLSCECGNSDTDARLAVHAADLATAASCGLYFSFVGSELGICTSIQTKYCVLRDLKNVK